MLNYQKVKINSLLVKMTVEIVDLASYNMVIFHSFIYVYQRVNLKGVSRSLHRMMNMDR